MAIINIKAPDLVPDSSAAFLVKIESYLNLKVLKTTKSRIMDASVIKMPAFFRRNFEVDDYNVSTLAINEMRI